MVTCSNCGFEHSEHDIDCPECGFSNPDYVPEPESAPAAPVASPQPAPAQPTAPSQDPAEVTCESCGFSIPADADVCPFCGHIKGSPIDGSQPEPEPEPEPEEPQMRSCVSCGFDIPYDARKCHFCGQLYDIYGNPESALVEEPEPEPEPEPVSTGGTGDMVCASCGAKLDPQMKFCPSCGSKVMREDGPAPKFCTECGAPLMPGANCCTNCGYMFRKPAMAQFVGQQAPAQVVAPQAPAQFAAQQPPVYQAPAAPMAQPKRKRCPECGTEFDATLTECPTCGCPVTVMAQASASVGPVTQAVWKCVECGCEIQPGQTECPNCGCPTEWI